MDCTSQGRQGHPEALKGAGGHAFDLRLNGNARGSLNDVYMVKPDTHVFRCEERELSASHDSTLVSIKLKLTSVH